MREPSDLYIFMGGSTPKMDLDIYIAEADRKFRALGSVVFVEAFAEYG
jgi:hypothetical protein